DVPEHGTVDVAGVVRLRVHVDFDDPHVRVVQVRLEPLRVYQHGRLQMSGYSIWIQPRRSSRATESRRAGWSVFMCARIAVITSSSPKPRATYPHSHRMILAMCPPGCVYAMSIATMLA